MLQDYKDLLDVLGHQATLDLQVLKENPGVVTVAELGEKREILGILDSLDVQVNRVPRGKKVTKETGQLDQTNLVR